MALRELIALHIGASGPVSLGSIAAYCYEQSCVPFGSEDIAAELNHLIRRGFVVIYDDGESFAPGPVRWNVLNEPEPASAKDRLIVAAREMKMVIDGACWIRRPGDALSRLEAAIKAAESEVGA